MDTKTEDVLYALTAIFVKELSEHHDLKNIQQVLFAYSIAMLPDYEEQVSFLEHMLKHGKKQIKHV